MFHRRHVLLGSAAALALPSSFAQAWPSQPIRLVVPFPPGGSSDIVARLLVPGLSDRLGQSIVVDNKPGAGATIGGAQVAQAAPNGYTLLTSNSATQSISPHLLAKAPYDPLKSFTHLVYIGAVPTVLVVHPSLPVNDFAGFLAWARAQKDPIPFGSGGGASVGHIVGELLADQAGIKLQHIPYKGAGPMRNDLLGGQLKVAIDALPANLQFQQTGQLKLLALTAPKRVPQAPTIPSVAELGFPGLVAENYVGISAPAGLPADVAQKLVEAIEAVVASADIQARLQQQGFVLERKSPVEFTALVQQQAQQWGPTVKATGATL